MLCFIFVEFKCRIRVFLSVAVVAKKIPPVTYFAQATRLLTTISLEGDIYEGHVKAAAVGRLPADEDLSSLSSGK